MKKLLSLLVLLFLFVPQTTLAWSEYNRLYHNNGDHYYTASQANVLSAMSQGYKREGFIGYVQDTAEAGTTPLYGAYHVATSRHFYTTNLAEYNSLTGWIKEGIYAYVSPTLTSNTTPLYRLLLSYGKHFYTTSEAEKNLLVSQGHSYEGIMGYLYKTSPVMVDTYVHQYSDGRPAPHYRQSISDEGVVLTHGSATDLKGARDVFVYEENGQYYMTYDGATNTKWSVNEAVSTDLRNWTKLGSVLSESVSCGCYGTIHKFGTEYLMYYLGSNSQSADTTPQVPYTTRKAHSVSSVGPWIKDGETFPLQSYYSKTGSPGPIIQQGNEYLMFFSAANNTIKRTLGIARSASPQGPWTPDPQPILPSTEQIENISLYQQDNTWYLFTNHVGINTQGEYTDSIWVYWSSNLESWDAADKAVVVDGQSSFSKLTIGLPSVVKVGNRLAILYDGKTNSVQDSLNRDIGLAWIELPIN